MVWQQWRAVQVEAAERARTQAAWVLTGGLDWSRVILREDAMTGRATSLGEPWATPLAETRLSTFLATDSDNNVDVGPEVFLSGAIRDAQSRYNLRNLVDGQGKLLPAELHVLEVLCASAGVADGTAGVIAEGLRAAWAPPASDGSGAGATLPPVRISQLTWLGLDGATVQQLAPYVDLLPRPTPVNLNTASREVLAAVIDGLDMGSAERLVQARQRRAFASLVEATAELPAGVKLDSARVAVRSSFFEVDGRLRLEDRVLEERSLVERRGQRGEVVVALQRTRRSLAGDAP
jgi:general secretion pathway protein K